jgi:hypothetical protein
MALRCRRLRRLPRLLPRLLLPSPQCLLPSRPAPQPPAATKVTYAADAFFDFDKAVLKPEGKAKLDDLIGKIKGINLEVIIAVGHTDSVGTDAYNQKLSVKRAESVKAYLVSKGIERTACTPKARARSSRRFQQDRRRPREEPSRGNRSGWYPRQQVISGLLLKSPATGLFLWFRGKSP